MSYIDHDSAFYGEIQEMSADEIGNVEGGFLSIISDIGAFFASPAGVATIAAAGAVVTEKISYVTLMSSEDCTTTKSYDAQGREVRSVTVCN